MKSMLVALFAVAVAGCSQKSPALPAQLEDSDSGIKPGGGGGTGGGGGITYDGGVSPDGGCLTVDNNASLVSEEDVADTLPTAIGGTLATGTYFLTAVNTYTGRNGNSGPTGNQYQETEFFDVATYTDARAVGNAEAGVGDTTYASGVYSTSGNVLSIEASCPSPGGIQKTFSVNGNTLHVFVGQTEYIYTQQ